LLFRLSFTDKRPQDNFNQWKIESTWRKTCYLLQHEDGC